MKEFKIKELDTLTAIKDKKDVSDKNKLNIVAIS